MTNNPTIDGVSRELLERSAYRLSDLKQCDLSEAIFTILSNPFKCSFCDDKKSVCVDWDAGEWMSCPRCSSKSDAPSVERQEPLGWAYCPECGSEEIHHEEGAHKQCAECHQEWFSDLDYTDLIRKHLGGKFTDLQSTIARLEARIAELESGRAEPVAVVLPERQKMRPYQTVDRSSANYKAGWNACLDATAALNAPKPTEWHDVAGDDEGFVS